MFQVSLGNYSEIIPQEILKREREREKKGWGKEGVEETGRERREGEEEKMREKGGGKKEEV